MAIDPRIALAGQPLNVQQAILGGQQVGQNFRQQGVRDQILNQQTQTQQISIAQTQGSFMNKFAKGLKGTPIEQRAAVVAQNLPLMEQLGISPEQVLGQDISNAGLDQIITGTEPFVQQGQSSLPSGIQEFQFLTQGLSEADVLKSKRIDLGLDARAKTGQIKQVSPGVFQSFDPNTQTLSDPFKIDQQGNQTPLTRQEQVDLKLSEDVKGITTRGGAKTGVAVSEAEQVGEVELDIASRKKTEELRLGRASTLKKQFSDQLRTAASSIPQLTEAFKLAEVADQGVTGAGKLFLSKLFPTIDVSDSAALDSALTNLALKELQKFKGPTTDFELGVTRSIAGDLIGSKSANLARIASLQRNNWFLQREAEQFNSWVDGGGDPDRFAFNFQETQRTKKGNFTLQQLQDTAVRNNISIQAVLERLSQ